MSKRKCENSFSRELEAQNLPEPYFWERAKDAPRPLYIILVYENPLVQALLGKKHESGSDTELHLEIYTF